MCFYIYIKKLLSFWLKKKNRDVSEVKPSLSEALG